MMITLVKTQKCWEGKSSGARAKEMHSIVLWSLQRLRQFLWERTEGWGDVIVDICPELCLSTAPKGGLQKERGSAASHPFSSVEKYNRLSTKSFPISSNNSAGYYQGRYSWDFFPCCSHLFLSHLLLYCSDLICLFRSVLLAESAALKSHNQSKVRNFCVNVPGSDFVMILLHTCFLQCH